VKRPDTLERAPGLTGHLGGKRCKRPASQENKCAGRHVPHTTRRLRAFAAKERHRALPFLKGEPDRDDSLEKRTGQRARSGITHRPFNRV
jgi:hypothetical protein